MSKKHRSGSTSKPATRSDASTSVATKSAEITRAEETLRERTHEYDDLVMRWAEIVQEWELPRRLVPTRLRQARQKRTAAAAHLANLQTRARFENEK